MATCHTAFIYIKTIKILKRKIFTCYAMIQYVMSSKINVLNPRPVGLASSHRDEGVFLVAEINHQKICLVSLWILNDTAMPISRFHGFLKSIVSTIYIYTAIVQIQTSPNLVTFFTSTPNFGTSQNYCHSPIFVMTYTAIVQIQTSPNLVTFFTSTPNFGTRQNYCHLPIFVMIYIL